MHIGKQMMGTLRRTLNSVSTEQSEYYQRLDGRTQAIVDAVREGRSCFDDSFQESALRMEELHRETQTLNIGEHEKTRAEIASALKMRSSVPSNATNALDEHYKTLHQSLAYPTMHYRQDDIAEAHNTTYEWIFRDPPTGRSSWPDFVGWLREGTGIYWVSGKPGSGKSTLMKYMYEDERFHDALRVWSGSAPFVIASFFAWKSGTKLEKSMEGLLRSLLYETLKTHPALIPVLFGNESTAYHQRDDSTWPIKRLRSLFVKLLKQNDIIFNWVMVVGGLDELEGDLDAIIDLLQLASTSSHVKLCLSSRPWVVFEDAFEECPSLKLHRFTHNDIQTYVHDQLVDNPVLRRSAAQRPGEMQDLVDETVGKASGVFIWVRVVVKSLLESLRNLDSVSDLKRRLQLLPADIEDLYDHMLAQVDPFYHPQASRLLQIVVQAGGSLSAIQLFFADEGVDAAISAPTRPMTHLEQSEAILKLEKWLASRCAGLLDVEDEKVLVGDQVGQYVMMKKVQLMHRTVLDYLIRPSTWQKLQLYVKDSSFVPSVSLLSSCILLLKRGPGFVPFQSHFHLVDASMEHARTAELIANESQGLLLNELDTTIRHTWGIKSPDDPLPLLRPIPQADSQETSNARIFLVGEARYARLYCNGRSSPAEDKGPNYLSSISVLASQHGLQLYLENRLENLDLEIKQDLSQSFLRIAMRPDPLDDIQPWHRDLVEMLLEKGAKPNQSANGRSPFEKLLDFGYRASSNWRHIRACQDHPCSSWMDTCEVLVRHGANTNRIHNESTEGFKRCSDRGILSLRLLQHLQRKGLLDRNIDGLNEQLKTALSRGWDSQSSSDEDEDDEDDYDDVADYNSTEE